MHVSEWHWGRCTVYLISFGFICRAVCIYNFSRSKQISFSQAPFTVNFVSVLKCINIFYLFHAGLWSMSCVCLRRWCICPMMKRKIPFSSSGVTMRRSRCAGIQIDSIERPLMVPLSPARKLKLMMECERMRDIESSKQEEAGGDRFLKKEEKKGKRGNTESRGGRKIKENTWKEKVGVFPADRELMVVSGWNTKEGLAHAVFLAI